MKGIEFKVLMVFDFLRSVLDSQWFRAVPLRSDPEKFDVNLLSVKDLAV